MKLRKPIKRKRGARWGPWRSVKYRRWVSEFMCCACYRLSLGIGRQGISVSQAAHVGNNGMSSKAADSKIVPLCQHHHDWYDGRTKLADSDMTLEYFHQIDLGDEAAQFYAQWLSEGNKP